MTTRTAARKHTAKPAAPITITLPKLAKGETYAGICLADGKL